MNGARRLLDHGRDGAQPFDHLQPRLRLPRLGAGAEAVDERLQVRAPRLDLGPHRALQRQPLGPLPLERGEAAGVERQLGVGEVQDEVHRAVEQFAVVTDHQRRRRVPLQPRLQPHRPFQVEEVGRLVQQQQVRLGEQRRGQRRAHAPAAGELGHRPGRSAWREPQAHQDLRRLGRRGVGADLGEAIVDVGHPLRRRGLQLGGEGRALGVRRQHRLQQRDRRRRLLLVGRADPSRARQDDLPAAGGEFALDQAEQRGLAGAIAADEADLGAGGEGGGRPIEEAAPVGVENEVLDAEHDGEALF